tara:strand:+ start:190 stop:492 length:303 start_codon:yes stop_codon:yes gene_type:complete
MQKEKLMSKVCQITGKKAMTGNNVSHANNRTKRKFIPNLQNVKLYSQSLEKYLNLKITVRTMKSVEKNGGIDSYLLKKSNRDLAPEAQKIKRSILKLKKN